MVDTRCCELRDTYVVLYFLFLWLEQNSWRIDTFYSYQVLVKLIGLRILQKSAKINRSQRTIDRRPQWLGSAEWVGGPRAYHQQFFCGGFKSHRVHARRGFLKLLSRNLKGRKRERMSKLYWMKTHEEWDIYVEPYPRQKNIATYCGGEGRTAVSTACPEDRWVLLLLLLLFSH